jgi:hypothetical protein
MTRNHRYAAFAASLMLFACSPADVPANDAEPATDATPTEARPVENPAVAPVDRNSETASEAAPDLTPPILTPEAERGEKGARNVLLSFARAIELKQFGQAWALLSPADKAKWSRADFATMFADLGKITVAVPTGTMEGAAGSSYYTAPVTITANDKDGRPVRIEGEAVLRRVNDVPGATAVQLRWHFEKVTLDWTH